jgi:hypothetical protein
MKGEHFEQTTAACMENPHLKQIWNAIQMGRTKRETSCTKLGNVLAVSRVDIE